MTFNDHWKRDVKLLNYLYKKLENTLFFPSIAGKKNAKKIEKG